jgi:hypothetical protein
MNRRDWFSRMMDEKIGAPNVCPRLKTVEGYAVKLIDTKAYLVALPPLEASSLEEGILPPEEEHLEKAIEDLVRLYGITPSGHSRVEDPRDPELIVHLPAEPVDGERWFLVTVQGHAPEQPITQVLDCPVKEAILALDVWDELVINERQIVNALESAAKTGRRSLRDYAKLSDKDMVGKVPGISEKRLASWRAICDRCGITRAIRDQEQERS